MRAFFDTIDAGRFDTVFLAIGSLFVAYAASEWVRAWRAAR